MGTVVVMIKSQIGLGVLSIPSAFDALGLIPGVLCLLGIGGMITWGNHVVGTFKRNHPEVYSIVDVGEKLGGKFGKEFMSVAFMLCKSYSSILFDRCLTIDRVDLCRSCWFLEYFNRFQRPVSPRCLHRRFCGSSRSHRFPHWLHPNPWKDYVARMGWRRIHHRRSPYLDHRRWSAGPPRRGASNRTICLQLQAYW